MPAYMSADSNMLVYAELLYIRLHLYVVLTAPHHNPHPLVHLSVPYKMAMAQSRRLHCGSLLSAAIPPGTGRTSMARELATEVAHIHMQLQRSIALLLQTLRDQTDLIG